MYNIVNDRHPAYPIDYIQGFRNKLSSKLSGKYSRPLINFCDETRHTRTHTYTCQRAYICIS